MILDKHLEFADGEDVSAAAGTEIMPLKVDLLAIGVRPNGGHNLQLVITVGTAFASGGSATVQFTLISDDSTLPTFATATKHLQTAAIPIADLPAGTRLVYNLPGDVPAYERYLALAVTTAVATTTAGVINAFITMGADEWKAFEGVSNG